MWAVLSLTSNYLIADRLRLSIDWCLVLIGLFVATLSTGGPVFAVTACVGVLCRADNSTRVCQTAPAVVCRRCWLP